MPSFDKHVEELHALARRASSALASAGIRHRIVGGLAVFIHVENRDPIAARLTRDVDMAGPRSELARIAEAARTVEFELRHVAGVDLLVDRANPSARKAVHLVFFDEKCVPNTRNLCRRWSKPSWRSMDWPLRPSGTLCG